MHSYSVNQKPVTSLQNERQSTDVLDDSFQASNQRVMVPVAAQLVINKTNLLPCRCIDVLQDRTLAVAGTEATMMTLPLFRDLVTSCAPPDFLLFMESALSLILG